MKFNDRTFENFLKKPDKNIDVVMVYGNDYGQVAERVKNLCSLYADTNDPFSTVTLTMEKLRDEPSALYDEAAAVSFFGGKKTILIKDADNVTLPSILKDFMKQPAVKDAFTVISAGSQKAGSKLRNILEKAENGAAVPCYEDEEQDIYALIQSFFSSKSITVEREAVDYLCHNLGADRQVTRSELEKILTYLGDSKTLSVDDAQNCVKDSSSTNLDELFYMLAEARPKDFFKNLESFYAEGNNSITLLRILQKNFQRMHICSGYIRRGESLKTAVNMLQPRVFWKYVNKFENLVRKWPEQHIAKVLTLLFDTENNCKNKNSNELLLCERTFIQILKAANFVKNR